MRRLALVLPLHFACSTGSVDAGPDTDTEGGAWEEPSPWLHSDRAQIRDEADRVVVLRGVNARVEGVFDVTFDDGRERLEPIPVFANEDAVRMRELGFNVLRLPINWSGVEPQRDVFDEDYLDRVEAVVDLCAANEIYVMIDFHQDAYSKEIGEDGAPLWAIEPPPTMVHEGPLTAEQLEEARTSPQVLLAFLSFFATDDGDPIDEELQAEFADMARHVAERFAGDPWVIGYELYNEPVAEDRYLVPFNNRITDAIREVDEEHLIFFEPNAIRNFMDSAPLASNRFRDDQGVYAPHLYSLIFTGGAELDTLTKERLEPNVEAALAEAESWETPLFIGEWGIGPAMTNWDLYTQWMYEHFDAHLLSATMWVWKENSQGNWGFYDWDEASMTWTERPEFVAAHSRPHPERIPGDDARFEVGDGRIDLYYQGRHERQSTWVFVPEPPMFSETFDVSCDGEAIWDESHRDPATGIVNVQCWGEGERHLAIVERED